MTRMPFWVTSRSERRLKRCGTQESIAMFERTRGPARKLAWAATKRSAPSETRQRSRKAFDPGESAPSISFESVRYSDAFSVAPGRLLTSARR